MLCVLLAAGAVCAQQTQAPQIFSARSTERARTLLGQMTVDEKIGQLTQEFVFQASPEVDERARTGRLGSALFVTDPNQINRLQHLAVEGSRLHIPLIFGFDVIHGFRTISPVPLALAASWDPQVVENADAAAAAEARAVGIDWAFAPMVDIARDPRWGRIVEGAGEDPYLGSAMARAAVRGFQGPEIGAPGHIMACAKHFAGYGAAEGGRDYDASYLSEAQLQNIYLPPFHAAVEAGAGSLMSAYMDLNDVPATGNRFLLTDTLRTGWGFQGFVVSDADAVKSLVKHGFARDPEDAAVRALGAGVNMEMALNDPAFDHLKAALSSGRVTGAQIDAAVLPILAAKYQLGLFEHPYVDAAAAETALSNPAHRETARIGAEKSAVLLRNEGTLLPLGKHAYKKIAVIGPTGSDPMDMTGPWTFVQKNETTVTIPDALRRKLGAEVTVDYAPGVQIDRFFPSFFDAIFKVQPVVPWSAEKAHSEFDRAVALARASDLILLTMGERQQMSGEAASASSLELPGDQQKLMEAVAALGKPVVLLLQNGRPLNIQWASQHVPAILETWHPGSEGGVAVANLLFGDAVPGGHLPITWPRHVGQIPITYDHNLTQDASKQGERYWNEPSTPLYPFGFGLSYGEFAYANLRVSKRASRVGEPLTVSVDVRNTGRMRAEAVPQLYLHQAFGRSSRPVRQLKGFRRITLEPGGSSTVEFALSPADFAYWSASDGQWKEDASSYTVWVGSDATASLQGSFERTAVP